MKQGIRSDAGVDKQERTGFTAPNLDAAAQTAGQVEQLPLLGRGGLRTFAYYCHTRGVLFCQVSGQVFSLECSQC